MFRVERKACVKARKNRSTASIKNLKAAHGRKKYRRKRVKKLDSGPERLDHIVYRLYRPY